MSHKLKVSARIALLMVFILAFVFTMTVNSYGYVSMSPDQVTCTPCHQDGRIGDGQGGEIRPDAGEDQEETPDEVDARITVLEPTRSGNLLIAPAADWDDLYSWVAAQQGSKIENKWDEAFGN